jgi:hypothetical protein
MSGEANAVNRARRITTETPVISVPSRRFGSALNRVGYVV